MPNFSPQHKSIWKSPTATLAAIYCLSACLPFAPASHSFAQTLARPGWTASGFTADPWWKHAVFYDSARYPDGEASPASDSSVQSSDDSRTTVEKLDALRSLGIDALIIPMPESPNAGPALDAFDAMVSNASRRGIRVILAMNVSAPTPASADRGRFWLSRGISGIYVESPPQAVAADTQASVQMIRKLANLSVGGRIVIGDLVRATAGDLSLGTSSHHAGRLPGNTSQQRFTQTAAQLRIDAQVDLPPLPSAQNLRTMILDEPQDPDVLLDLHVPPSTAGPTDPYSAIAKAISTLELTTHPAALTDADLIEGNSMEWYRQLIALHHGNATLRYGTAVPLDFDAQNALVWVSRASDGSVHMLPVIVVCNLSSSPLHLSLGSAVKRMGLHGSFLRTLLRTDHGMGPQDLESVAVPPFGIYIGELRR